MAEVLLRYVCCIIEQAFERSYARSRIAAGSNISCVMNDKKGCVDMYHHSTAFWLGLAAIAVILILI
jgi:hypothetical protein